MHFCKRNLHRMTSSLRSKSLADNHRNHQHHRRDDHACDVLGTYVTVCCQSVGTCIVESRLVE